MHWPIYRPSADQLNCLHVCPLVKIHSTGYEWRAMSEFLSQNLKRKHLSTSSSLSPSFSHIEKKINFTTNSGTSNTSSMADHSESLGDPGILSQSLQSKIAMINQGQDACTLYGTPLRTPTVLWVSWRRDWSRGPPLHRPPAPHRRQPWPAGYFRYRCITYCPYCEKSAVGWPWQNGQWESRIPHIVYGGSFWRKTKNSASN